MTDRQSQHQLTKILVADDDGSIRTFLTESMRLEGYDVTATADGGEALAILSSGDAPSLAILDWNMPTLDGIELCRRVREVKDHGLLYIIMITGQTGNRDVVAALDAGADDFLKKPFRREELLARVRSGRRILSLSHEKIDMVTRLEKQQRLESIGQLAAGIAHEINTPMQYIGDNTRFIQDSLLDIFAMIKVVKNGAMQVKNGANCSDVVCAVEKAMADADLDYLNEQIPLAVHQTLEGIERVTKIVCAMKEFAHPGSGDATPTDLNHLLETAVTVTRNEWKYVSEVIFTPLPNLPPVCCYPGDLNQVIINLIVNAAHTIAEKQLRTGDTDKGEIRLTPALIGEKVEIRVSDTGCGIPLHARNRIMEPFFTTKEVGKGTGQGLAIARSVIVDKHGGTLEYETEEGVGTTFIVRIPLSNETLSIS